MPIRHRELYIETHRKLYRHLDFDGDGMEVAIKGHLLIESILHQVLAISAKRKDLLDGAKLTYFQVASIAHAFHEGDIAAWVWKAVFDLNRIRNRLAHDLEFPGLDDMIEAFEEFVEGNEDGSMNLGSELGFSRFPMAIVTVHGELWRLVDKKLL